MSTKEISLPNEMLLEISEFLVSTFLDAIRFSMTCKQFFYVLEEFETWKRLFISQWPESLLDFERKEFRKQFFEELMKDLSFDPEKYLTNDFQPPSSDIEKALIRFFMSSPMSFARDGKFSQPSCPSWFRGRHFTLYGLRGRTNTNLHYLVDLTINQKLDSSVSGPYMQGRRSIDPKDFLQRIYNVDYKMSEEEFNDFTVYEPTRTRPSRRREFKDYSLMETTLMMSHFQKNHELDNLFLSSLIQKYQQFSEGGFLNINSLLEKSVHFLKMIYSGGLDDKYLVISKNRILHHKNDLFSPPQQQNYLTIEEMISFVMTEVEQQQKNNKLFKNIKKDHFLKFQNIIETDDPVITDDDYNSKEEKENIVKFGRSVCKDWEGEEQWIKIVQEQEFNKILFFGDCLVFTEFKCLFREDGEMNKAINEVRLVVTEKSVYLISNLLYHVYRKGKLFGMGDEED